MTGKKTAAAVDKGEIQQYAGPQELLRHPATDYVKKLVEKERRRCSLPGEKLGDCEYSGVGGCDPTY